MGVYAGADGGTAKRHFRKGFLRPPHTLDAVAGLPGVAQELLPQPYGGCVLQVGTSGLDDGPEFLGLLLQLSRQVFQSGDQVFPDGEQGGQVDRGGNDVVGRLAHIDVVIGVDQTGTKITAQELAGPIGDDFVGVGVCRGTGAGLEDVQHEVAVELSVYDFLGRSHDGIANALVEQAQGHIAAGGGLLDETKGADEGSRETQAADGKVQHGAHCGCTIQSVGGHFHFAHGVALYSHVRTGGHGGAILQAEFAIGYHDGGAGAVRGDFRIQGPPVLHLEGDGFLDGAGDEAEAGGPGQQVAEELAGLGEMAKFETTLQITAEMGETLEPEAAFTHPPEEDVGPLVGGPRAAPLFAGYGVGEVVAESFGDGLEAVDFEFVGVLALGGVHEATDLGDGH